MNDKIGVVITISKKSLHLYNSYGAFMHCVRNIYTKMMKLAMDNAKIKDELSLLLQK